MCPSLVALECVLEVSVCRHDQIGEQPQPLRVVPGGTLGVAQNRVSGGVEYEAFII
jgi:hypothetical protein